jgi:hypothetical protein
VDLEQEISYVNQAKQSLPHEDFGQRVKQKPADLKVSDGGSGRQLI